jgi:flagellar biogenesis protein FliO
VWTTTRESVQDGDEFPIADCGLTRMISLTSAALLIIVGAAYVLVRLALARSC